MRCLVPRKQGADFVETWTQHDMFWLEDLREIRTNVDCVLTCVDNKDFHAAALALTKALVDMSQFVTDTQANIVEDYLTRETTTDKADDVIEEEQ